MGAAIDMAAIEADFAREKRSRRWRAWLFVKAHQALAILDHEPRMMEMSRANFDVYLHAQRRYSEECAAAGAVMRRINDVRLEALCKAKLDLTPNDNTAQGIGEYLSHHGVPDSTISTLLAAWPRSVAA